MKRAKLFLAVFSVLLLTAFFLLFPQSYLKARTRSETLSKREIALPLETEKPALQGMELYDALEMFQKTNTIFYKSKDLKPRKTYAEQIESGINAVFSGFETFCKNLIDKIRFGSAEIRRFCFVSVGDDGTLIQIALIDYRSESIECCFEETNGTPIFFRFEEMYSQQFLEAQPIEMSDIRAYFAQAGLPSISIYNRFYEVNYNESGFYTVLLGDSQFYWKLYGLFMNPSYDSETDFIW